MGRSLFIFIFLNALIIKTSFGFLPQHKVDGVIGEKNISQNGNWYNLAKTDDERTMILLRLLSKSRAGKEMILRAKKKANAEGVTLLDLIKPGDVSVTDTTLVRRFSPDRPDIIVYSTKSKIFIDKSHTVLDATLDLAHEMTHFIHRAPFNPYEDNFNLKDFIISIIEGKGGEVDAYLTECRVALSLFPKQTDNSSKCHLILEDDGKSLNRNLATKYFYQMGGHLDDFLEELEEMEVGKESLTYLNSKQSLFISSAYGIPYPIAAVKEYQQIMKRVCDNDYKRLGIAEDTIKRTLASVKKSEKKLESKSFQEMKSSFSKRCSKFRH